MVGEGVPMASMVEAVAFECRRPLEVSGPPPSSSSSLSSLSSLLLLLPLVYPWSHPSSVTPPAAAWEDNSKHGRPDPSSGCRVKET